MCPLLQVTIPLEGASVLSQAALARSVLSPHPCTSVSVRNTQTGTTSSWSSTRGGSRNRHARILNVRRMLLHGQCCCVVLCTRARIISVEPGAVVSIYAPPMACSARREVTGLMPTSLWDKVTEASFPKTAGSTLRVQLEKTLSSAASPR